MRGVSTIRREVPTAFMNFDYGFMPMECQAVYFNFTVTSAVIDGGFRRCSVHLSEELWNRSEGVQ